MNLIDIVNEINPEIEQELARMIEPGNEYELIGYLTEWLESKGYYISVAYHPDAYWIGDITTPDGDDVITNSKEFRNSTEARRWLIIESCKLYNKQK